MNEQNQDQSSSKADQKNNALLMNILGNAMDSSIKYGETQSGLETRKCSSCGAARPEGSALSTCDYCGFQFFKES